MAPGSFASIAIARQLIEQRNRRTANLEGRIVIKQTIPTKGTPSVSQLPEEFGMSPPQLYNPTASRPRAIKALKAFRSRPGISVAQVSPTQRLDQMLDASTAEPARSALTTPNTSAIIPQPSKTTNSIVTRPLPTKTSNASGADERQGLSVS